MIRPKSFNIMMPIIQNNCCTNEYDKFGEESGQNLPQENFHPVCAN